MRATAKRFALASAIGAVGLSGLAMPASAAPRPATYGFTVIAAKTLPNVDITGTKKGTWDPTKLTVAPKTYTTCTAKKEVWTITNETKTAQTIYATPKGGTKETLGSLPAGDKGGICSEGPSGATSVFTLKGSSSKLTLTLS